MKFDDIKRKNKSKRIDRCAKYIPKISINDRAFLDPLLEQNSLNTRYVKTNTNEFHIVPQSMNYYIVKHKRTMYLKALRYTPTSFFEMIYSYQKRIQNGKKN